MFHKTNMDALKRYIKLFRRIIVLVLFKPDRAVNHLVNRLLFRVPARGLAGRPFAFYIGVNARCNLRCKSCDVGQKQTDSYLYKNMAGKPELTLDEWKTVIDRIAGLKPYIEISAVEPLLYKDIIGLLEFIKLEKRLNVSVTTNGLLLERYAAALVKLGVDRVNVSIDGPREIHNAMRGAQGVFEAAVKGMRAILSYQRRPLLGINYTISDYNCLYLCETIEQLSSLAQWDVWTFIHFSFITGEMAAAQNNGFTGYPATAAEVSGVDTGKINTGALVRQIEQIKRKFKHRNVLFHPDMPLGKIETYYRRPSVFVLKKRCIMPWISASILSNGDVVAFNRCPTGSFGNLLRTGFNDIWNSAEFRAFRMTLKRAGAFPVCSRCGSLKMK